MHSTSKPDITECLTSTRMQQICLTALLHWPWPHPQVSKSYPQAQMQLSKGLTQLSLQQHTSLTTMTQAYLQYLNWKNMVGFLIQCHLYFNAHAGMNEQIEVNHFMNFLNDKTLTWATALWQGLQSQTLINLSPYFSKCLIILPMEKK